MKPRTLVVCAVIALGLLVNAAQAQFTLTILHNNDGESALLPDGDEGGIGRFVSLVTAEKAASTNPIMLSSGDNWLAGKSFSAGLGAGVGGSNYYYDAEALKAIGYDAVVLGNHDFDFGPDILDEFVTQANTGSSTKFLSANLDFSAHAGLNNQVTAGNIAKSTVLTVSGEKVGIVGATTPNLKNISSPGVVVVDPNVVNAVQTQINDLINNQGVNKVILVSHLQSVAEDLALIPQLSGVDVAIAGGGDELLANSPYPTSLLPTDQLDVKPVGSPDGIPDVLAGPYPILTTDYTATANGSTVLVGADGMNIPVVTTSGQYGYLGKLVVDFDALGNVTNLATMDTTNNPVRNYGLDGIAANTTVVSNIEDPISSFFSAVDNNIIGTTTDGLDGRKTSVRGEETNLGNLVADSMVWYAQQNASAFGVSLDNPVIGLQNGGGLRNDDIITGNVSEGDTFDIAPFSNFVAVLEDLPIDRVLAALENAVSRVEFGDGRFAQISGLKFTYNPQAAAGSRIVDVFLSDGTQIIGNGSILPAHASDLFDLATINFLLNDKDGYDWDGDGIIGDDSDVLPYSILGASYQQALADYIENGLGGAISGPAYATGGEGRITEVPEPTTLALIALGGLAALRRRRA